MTHILITGANSFVGTSFRRFSGNENINEVDMIENKPEDIDFKGIDVVLHVAAIVHQTKTIQRREYFKINSNLAWQVAKKAKADGVNHFVFMSTIKVYGIDNTNGSVLKEDSVCSPNDAYSESKYEAEGRIRDLEDDTFIVSVIRTPLVYGPGVKGNMIALVKLINSIKIIPLGGISNARSITNVDNLIDLIKKILVNKKSGIFIACDDKPISTSELVKLISKHLNKEIYLIHLAKLFWNLIKWIKPNYYTRLYGSLVFDNSETKKKLNYSPRFSTDEGIKKMIDWYKSN